MAAEDWHSLSVQPATRVGEGNDTSESFATQQVEATAEHPGFAVAGHLVEQDESPQLDGVQRTTWENTGEHPVIARVRENGNALENTTTEQPEPPARGRVGAAVMVFQDKVLRGRVVR
jgi:hypothetical protein